MKYKLFYFFTQLKGLSMSIRFRKKVCILISSENHTIFYQRAPFLSHQNLPFFMWCYVNVLSQVVLSSDSAVSVSLFGQKRTLFILSTKCFVSYHSSSQVLS